MKVVLVSDMFGKYGDVGYMRDWNRFFCSQGFAVFEVWVSDFIPGAYSPLIRDGLHDRITENSNISLAKSGLSRVLHEIRPDLVVGFSYGGYISFLASLDFDFYLSCISSTRLRFVDGFFLRSRSFFAFAEGDSFLLDGLKDCSDSVLFFDGFDHDFYKDPSVSGEVVLKRFYGEG
ncbi:MAG: hypothetical protein Q4D91_14050 [Lautropia sp.]|nr:hypothetical protein [Lautropia sp.]